MIYLTIFICTYKRDLLLNFCLHSIKGSIEYYRQNGGDLDVEIIVSDDDANRENPLYYLSEVGVGFTIKYYLNDRNLGDYGNRNTFVNRASGEWLKYVDDDDSLNLTDISTLLKDLQFVPSDVVVVQHRENLHDSSNHPKRMLHLNDETAIFNQHFNGSGVFFASLARVTFRRNPLICIGAFKFKRFYSDFYSLIELTNQGGYFFFSHEIGVYNTHDFQESAFNRSDVIIDYNYNVLLYFYLYNRGVLTRFNKEMKIICFQQLKRALKLLNVTILKSLLYVLIHNMIGDSKIRANCVKLVYKISIYNYSNARLVI